MTRWIASGAIIGSVVGVPAGAVLSFFAAWVFLERYAMLPRMTTWAACWLAMILLAAAVGAYLGYAVYQPKD